jgi:general secretion pathway protein E/type IV pilus assembly protein PilB
LAWHYRVVPKLIEDDKFVFYIDENQDQQIVQEELEVVLGKKIELESFATTTIQQALGTYFRQVEQKSKSELKLTADSDFVDRIIQEANALGSSDIHIEIYEDRGRVRIRIDGHLIERYRVDLINYPELVNKIKIRSNLDISEKRLPQDGRIQYDDFDIRVSILPTLHGEKIVMRILGQDASNLSIAQIGMSEKEQVSYLEGIKKPNGIILISGPTGSGKTTTLYATLKLLNEEKRNIVTVEDPIEYTLEGINQVQLKEDIGLTFTSALRSFLRQDPDVIMLGEIRDGETAQMAIRAALTGHLVLSTIHTNSAWGTISRLLDMGVPSFLLANTINCSVAQRLVRKLCDNCKIQAPLDVSDLPSMFPRKLAPKNHFIKVGCEACHYTGYKGRRAIYEIIPIDGELGDYIKEDNMKVDDALKKRNIQKLHERARQLWVNGTTTLEEVYPFLMEE